MELVEFKVQITEKDFIRFIFWSAFVRGRRIVFTYILPILYTVLICIFIISLYYYQVQIHMIIIFVAILLLYPFFIAMLYFNGKKSYKTDSFFKMEYDYKISDESIITSYKDSKTEIKGENIYKVYFTENYIFIGISTVKYLIVPKRFIPEGKVQTVMEYIKAIHKSKGKAGVNI